MTMWILVASALASVTPQVADAVAVGDCAAVVKGLPSPDEDDERLAAGHCLRRLGRAQEAADVLAEVAAPGVLSDYARYERAVALADAGKPDDAIAVVKDLK